MEKEISKLESDNEVLLLKTKIIELTSRMSIVKNRRSLEQIEVFIQETGFMVGEVQMLLFIFMIFSKPS